MKKRILILGNHEIVIYNFRKELIERLLKEDYEIYLSFPKGSRTKYFEDLGCHFIETKIERHGINPIRDINLLINYLRIIMKINPDFVLTYTIKPNIYGGLAARIMKKKYITNVTGIGKTFQKNNILKKIIVSLYRISLKNAQMIFFQNLENRNIFNSNKIFGKNESILPGSGVNLSEYNFTPKEIEGKINFLYIGRIMKDKGIEEYLYASNKLKKQKPNCNFHIIGFFEEEKYKEIINEYQEKGIISYHGFQNDVKKYIIKSDCIVNPSHHEGMSNVLLEGGAIGRVLIASNISGCKEIVQDSLNGYTFEVKNKESLFDKLEKFSNLSRKEIENMSLSSRKKIESEFDRNIIIDSYLKIFNKN